MGSLITIFSKIRIALVFCQGAAYFERIRLIRYLFFLPGLFHKKSFVSVIHYHYLSLLLKLLSHANHSLNLITTFRSVTRDRISKFWKRTLWSKFMLKNAFFMPSFRKINIFGRKGPILFFFVKNAFLLAGDGRSP